MEAKLAGRRGVLSDANGRIPKVWARIGEARGSDHQARRGKLAFAGMLWGHERFAYAIC